MWDALFINARLATMADAGYGLIDDGAVAVKDGRIVWLGAMAALPAPAAELAAVVHDEAGRLLTPGLVDAHTHIVHAGERCSDFVLRNGGAGRNEIAAAGGGVRGTMYQTRATSDEALYEQTARRVRELIAHGVTTFESKSGYGLDFETELRIMRVSRELGRRLPVTVRSTFLGAHGVGPEYDGRPDDYVAFLARTVLPAAVQQDLVDAVDGFCDRLGFNHAQIGVLFDAATAFGLPVKLHADQYNEFGAGAVVAKYKGLSADHLEYASEATVRAMAEADTVAGLLPGANWTLLETARPPVELFRRYGLSMMVATNNNPSSSPTCSPTMMMNMATHMFRITPEEALLGFTRVGAKALGLAADRGTLERGKVADFAVWNVAHPAELSYRIAVNPCRRVVKDGAVIYDAPPLHIAERAGRA
ncbi:MAG: imidazolonepropionase [Proteobacteria bacterium]|nr:imidazolonepropionase [Pseudomonadota bacterium]